MLVPGSLKIVAYLFMLNGGLAIAKTFIALLRSNIRIDFDILCLFAGLGLFSLSTGWWKFAKIYTLIYIFSMPLVVILLLGSTATPTARMLTILVGGISKELALLLIACAWIIALWEYSVLTADNVCRLYERSEIATENKSSVEIS